MADRWETFRVECTGGLIIDADALKQGMQQPGSAIKLINYEPNPVGGYRRVSGYAKYDATAVPGTGYVQAVHVSTNHVYAARDGYLYSGQGNGWTQLNPSNRLAVGNVFFHVEEYRSPIQTIVVCDGTNKPLKWDGTTLAELTAAPVAARCSKWFTNHLFIGNGSKVTFSAPNNDANFAAADGAGEFVVGDIVVALEAFRDQLIIFCQNSIYRVTGTSSADFVLRSVTQDIGCADGRTVHEIGGDLMFLSSDGIRPLSATERLGDFEIESISRDVASTVRALMDNSFPCAAVVRNKTQYRLFGFTPGSTRALSRGIIGGLRKTDMGLRYEWSELLGVQATCAASGIMSGREVVVHGTPEGYVMRQETGTTFDGANIQATFQTPFISFDNPSIRKNFYKIRVYLEVEGPRDITLTTVLDEEDPDVVQPAAIAFTAASSSLSTYGTAVYGIAVYDVREAPQSDQNLIGSFFTTAFKFYTDDGDPSFSIKSFTVEYALKGRR